MSVTPPTRRRGRPAKFSAEDVIRSALAAGIGSFTQSDVALELGVTVQSVYRRFPPGNCCWRPASTGHWRASRPRTRSTRHPGPGRRSSGPAPTSGGHCASATPGSPPW